MRVLEGQRARVAVGDGVLQGAVGGKQEECGQPKTLGGTPRRQKWKSLAR
jgi:hypothetical protein